MIHVGLSESAIWTSLPIIARDDELNKTIGNFCKFFKQVCAVTEAAKAGDRDDHNCSDEHSCYTLYEAQSGFEWANLCNPLTVEIAEVMDKYIGQLIEMPLGEFPVAYVDDCTYEYVPIFRPQSGHTADVELGDANTDEKHATMTFKDSQPGPSSDAVTFVDETRKMQDLNDANLGDFFSRPVKIFTITAGTGVLANASFNPWDLFFSNKRVANRIANFKLMRCNLKLKVVINGNSFLYGRYLVAYWPMAGFDSQSTHSALGNSDLVQTSQLPHLFLDPCMSMGGEMTLPFFWHENYFDVVRQTWGTSGGQPDCGRILVRTINALKHTVGVTEQVTISFFAWAEDMQLVGPTGAEPGTLGPQSGKEIDEANKDGIVSGPASTISKYSAIAATYKPIAPYAMATSKVAAGIADVARVLGYSRPPMTANPEPFRPTPISQLATTTTPDTALRLTVDDKQELTIDPRISGVGEHDPLVIREIAKRESYLMTFPWQLSAVQDQVIQSFTVDPCLFRQDGSPGFAITLPALAAAALPFQYWTGTLKFRFQIVCATSHRGRLMFTYDPHFLDADTRLEHNIAYTHVIDIAETQDFTLEVGIGQPLNLLRHLEPGLDSQTECFSDSLLTNYVPGRSNGTITVRVLNTLTALNPTIDNNIAVNVFVSAGEDFEVFKPNNLIGKYNFGTQSGVEQVPEGSNTNEPSAPQHSETEILGFGPQFSPTLNKVFIGESIVSFRPLLKRYNLWRRERNSLEGLNDQVIISREHNYVPYFKGRNVNSTDDGGYQYCNTVLLHWVMMGFAGFRGSIRYKWLFGKSTGCTGGSPTACCDDPGSKVYVETVEPGATGVAADITIEEQFDNPSLTNEDVSRQAMQDTGFRVPSGLRGTVFATDLINPNVEFEVPYQTQYRFVPGKTANWHRGNIYTPRYKVHYQGHTTVDQTIDMHVAAGEDFQVYFWTGLPKMRFELNGPPLPPTPDP